MTIDRIEDLALLNDVLDISIVSEPPVNEQPNGTLKPANYPEGIDVYRIKYRSHGQIVFGYIAVPQDYLSKNYPVLIFNRGGNREFGNIVSLPVSRFASLGFIAAGSVYRGNSGGYSESPDITSVEDFGGKDIIDVITLLDIVQNLTKAREGKAFIAGHSRGGLETYRLISEYGDRFEAASVTSGVADCFEMYDAREESMKDVFRELLKAEPWINPGEYAIRSAVLFANKINVPVLIQHGSADWRVHLSQAVRLHEQLDRHNVENKLIVYEGAGHQLDRCPKMREIRKWFLDHGYPDIPELPDAFSNIPEERHSICIKYG